MRICFSSSKGNERGLGINETALLPQWQWSFENDNMQSRIASTASKWDGAMSADESLEKDLSLPEGCRTAQRGHGRGGNEEAESDLLVAAALSMYDKCGGGFAGAGGWRSALLCFFSGRLECVAAVFASRVLSRFRSDACPKKKCVACLYHDGC